MFRFAFSLIVASSFLGVPVLAGEPSLSDSPATVEASQKRVIVPLPRLTRRSLSTRERWRGTPYTRSAAADEQIRAEALDKALPVISSAAGGSLPGFGFAGENTLLRSEALDKALPVISNPTTNSGIGFGF